MTKRCPLTYLETTSRYSSAGLKQLGIKDLAVFPYTALEQLQEAAQRANKMSIQGVQPKLSAMLNKKECRFELVDQGGKYIIKPQHVIYPELPQNEDLTMRLAKMCGIDTPWHGLIYAVDESLSYVIKRFDRQGWGKLPVEDFAQLSGNNRDTKYDSSMEKVAKTIDEFCTFPLLEKSKLFRLTLFSFLIGNEDMHLKNFSVIIRDKKVELSPAYDLLNTTIVLNKPSEELALTLAGKKNNLTKTLLLEYFPLEYLRLSKKQTALMISSIVNVLPAWQNLIRNSFLSSELQQQYLELLNSRCRRLGFDLPSFHKE